MTNELVTIQPGELRFPFQLRKQSSCSLQLNNNTDIYVAFKVKTTAPKQYCVRPNHGVLPPNGTCNVIVTMQAPMEAPPAMQCKDKFLVQTVIAPAGATVKDVTPEMFRKEPDKVIEENKLRVVYIAPTEPPSTFSKSSEEGLAQKNSSLGNISPNVPSVDRVPKDICDSEAKLSEIRNELVTIWPGELKFPFELQKQSSCSFQLINNKDIYVAFKVKTKAPKNYCVRPTHGVLPPNGTCDVIVTMQAPTKAPPGMQCKDKFLVQTVLALSGTTIKDVTPEMFNKVPDKFIEENKLRVVYVATPEPRSMIPESLEEGLMQKDSSLGKRSPTVHSVHHVPEDITELKTKLSEARSAILKLAEEKAAAIQQKQKIEQELELMKRSDHGRSGRRRLSSLLSAPLRTIISWYRWRKGYIPCREEGVY